MFTDFRNLLNSEMKRLKSAGLGSHVWKAEPLTPEEEEILWDKGIFGDSTPRAAEHRVLQKQSTLHFKVALNTASYATRTAKSKWLSNLGNNLIRCILRTLLKITKVVSKGGKQVLRR